MGERLKTYNQVAAELGVYRWTISDVVRKWGIEPKPMPSNRKAKGLNARDIKVVRKALNMKPVAA